MHPLSPTPDFNSAKLLTRRIAAGRIYGRINRASFTDPLGFGYNPTRFSDPQVIDPKKQFGVVYLGEGLAVCFLEAVLRDQRNGAIGDYPIGMSELTSRTYANIGTIEPLKLVDLTADKKVLMGIPTDVTNASDQTLGRLWSEAIHQHPAEVDGILYESRLSRKLNLAIYDRALPKLQCMLSVPLLKAMELPRVLDRYKIAIAP
jgi:hypothetical protein